jgi:formylmethanofuran dehydrogenase subunit B/formate hydrogenlyase subunit 6/NADH:ubiquinone oxidoreductase subunit I/ferredoxin
MDRVSTRQQATMPIEFKLNGKTVVGRPDEPIIETAKRHGVEIPHLCYTPGLRPDGNCRACVVEVKGERTLAPSCCRYPKEGMEVTTDSTRARLSQKMVLELLLADMPEKAYRKDSELDQWAKKLEVGLPRFPARHQPKADLSHPAIAVNLDACIQCTRCLRACREEQVNDVIGYAWRGEHAKIVFDFDDPMGESTCVACGECVQACPTGALAPAREAALAAIDKTVDSVCPFCGVGCLLTYHVKDNVIRFVTGKDGPSNHGRLCVKGRYGFDYAHHPHRLTRPLIRKPGVAKSIDFKVDPASWREMFREASWEEALELAAGGLKKIRDADKAALAGFGSAKGSNEEAYLFQKLVRTGFGTNNVDHCTRLCHASSVAALLEGIGSGAVSNQVNDVANSEVIFLIGANPTSNHPVAATWLKNAAQRGAKLIIADPRRTDLARHASHFLQFKPDTDVALLNAMIHAIIDEGLVNEAFIRDRTSGYEALAENAKAFSPEKMAPVCGIPAGTIREVARLYATSKASIILWGMGISQHVHGTDNARCLIALTLMTGQVGRPGTGLHPLRGQNNVQGASDSGLIPMMYPDYQRVATPEAKARFEKFWGAELDPKPGLTVVEIMDAAYDGKIRGMYIMGENPAMSDPGPRARARGDGEARAPRGAGHLPHRDRLSRRRGAAGDGLAGEGRHGHQYGSHGAARPQGAGCAGAGEAGPVDHPGARAAPRPRLELRRAAGRLERDARLHGLDPRHHLGAPGARLVGDLPLRERGRSGPAGRVPDAFSDRDRARQVRARGPDPRRRASGQGLSDGADHRPPARALAHGRDDAPRGRARCDRARAGRVAAPARPRGAEGEARRRPHRRVAPRPHLALRARRRRHAARRGVHPLRLPGSGGEPADQPGARSLRQDPGVQVLRGEGHEGRDAPRGPGLWQGALARADLGRRLTAVKRARALARL